MCRVVGYYDNNYYDYYYYCYFYDMCKGESRNILEVTSAGLIISIY